MDTAAIGIAEILQHGFGNILGVGTATARAVHHVDGDAAMEHEQSNGVDLFRWRHVADGIQHLVEFVGGCGEIGRNHSILGVFITMFSCAVGRVFPIVHHLRHGGSHATCVGKSFAFGPGTEFIVGVILVPPGLHQMERRAKVVARGHFLTIQQCFPFFADLFIGSDGRAEGDLPALTKVVEIIHHLG